MSYANERKNRKIVVPAGVTAFYTYLTTEPYISLKYADLLCTTHILQAPVNWLLTHFLQVGVGLAEMAATEKSIICGKW